MAALFFLRINNLTFPNFGPIFAAQNQKRITMLPTLTFMKQTFRRFNYEYFHGSLPTPTFKISSSSVYMGTCARYPSANYSNTYVITCSKYFDCPLEELENTMLHEMCHLWVFINHPYTTEPSHGPIWQSIANKVTMASNYKYVIAAESACFYTINPPAARPRKKSSRPSRKKRVTPKPSFRRTLLRTLFLLMILVLFL